MGGGSRSETFGGETHAWRIDRGDSPGIFLDALHVRNDTLFITWHAESKHLVFPFGTDTFICNGGKFERQSIAFSTPKPR